MQKHVNLVDLVESFPTIYYLEKLASMQPRTSLWKFGIWSHQDGNLEIWTGENSYSNSQISVGIGNLNCGARIQVVRPGVLDVMNHRSDQHPRELFGASVDEALEVSGDVEPQGANEKMN